MSPLLPLGILAAIAALLWPRKSVAASITVGTDAGFDMDTVAKHNTMDGFTRGERNNNPGNIAANPLNKWQGQQGDDGTYCIFDVPQNGIRAIAHVLRSYIRRGVNTIETMIHTYSATDQKEYVANVSAALGMHATDEPDLDDLDTLVTMVTAIIHQENGRNIYPSDLITTAVQT
jgi:hypothetical protein